MYDCIIIGCGPSGMTCALYLKRSGKKVLILERSMPGGQMVITTNVENYPGFSHIDGASLATSMFEQITSIGVEVIFEDVIACDLKGKVKRVKTDKNQYESKCVYIATGATSRLLNVEGEKRLTSKGVSYCATCDGALYKEKVVAVVGGGNTSLEDCLYLSNVAKKIYLIHRRDEFRGDEILVKRIKELREQRNLSQEYIAEQLDIHPANYWRIENGVSYPKPENLEKICEILEVKPQGLFTFEHLKSLNDIKSELHEIINSNDDLARLIYKFVKTLKD